jgi:hypothetical protein
LQGEAKELFLSHDVSHRFKLKSSLRKRLKAGDLCGFKNVGVMRQQPSAIVQGSPQSMQQQYLGFKSGQSQDLAML